MNIFRGFAIVLLLMHSRLHAFNNTTLGPPDTKDSVKASIKPTEYLYRISTVAHIANGITLQAGLMNGTIQIDEVVGEMLNLGSAKVSDLANYKPDKILELITKLKEVRQKVAANDKTTDMENRALNWEDYRFRSEFIGDVTNLTGSVEYFKAVENFQDKFNFTLFESTAGQFEKFNKSITFILKDSLKDETFAITGSAKLKIFNATFQSLKELLTGIKTVNRTSSFYIMMNGTNTFKSLDTVIKLSALRQNYHTLYTDDGKNLIKRNIDLVSALSALHESSRGDMMTVSKFSDRLESIPSRKFTSGFPRGLIDMEQLTEDVQNQWFLEMINATELDRQSMRKSLMPMFSAFETLNDVNKKLKVTFPERTQFQQFKDDPYFIPVNATSSVDIMMNYRGCYNKGGQQPGDFLKKGVEFIANVKTVSDWLTAFDNFTKMLDLDQLEKDVTVFVGSLNFTDINDRAQSEMEVIEIVKNIRSKNISLIKIQESVEGVENQFNAVRLDILKSTFFSKIAHGVTEDKNLKEVIDAENSVNKCLQSVKNKSLAISEAIKTIQKLRLLDDKLLESVQQTATSLAQFSNDLSTVTSIPNAMKKGVKNVTLQLNKMSLKSFNQSDGIGYSASALQSVFSLLDLESSISQLESVDGLVNVEMNKAGNKSELKNLWGSHNDDIISLEDAIAKPKVFKSKIDVSKAHTLFSYSTPLKNLAAIPDVKIDAVKKAKALDILISSLKSSVKRRTKRDTKSDLLAAKATLDKIALLDLQFSSHSTQLQQSLSAFQSFDIFLQLFFASQQTISVLPPNPQNNGGGVNTGGTGNDTSSGGPNGGTDVGTGPTGSGTGVGTAAVIGSSTVSTVSDVSNDFPILFVVIPVVLILVAIAIGGMFFTWYRKREEKRKEKEAEEEREQLIAERKRMKEEEEKVIAERKKIQEKEQKVKAEKEKIKAEEERLKVKRKNEKDDEKEKVLKEEKEKEEREKLIEAIEERIKSMNYKDYERTPKFYNTMIENVNAATIDKDHITESYSYLPKDKHRFTNVPCKPSTAVEVIVDGQRVPIHANWIPTPGHPHRFIATQMMLMQYDVEEIVMLCKKKENLIVKCNDYFPPTTTEQLKIGRFDIKITKMECILNKKVIQRALEVVDSTGIFATRTLMHYQYSEWTERAVPNGHVETFELMEILKKSEKPIVVQCSNGIGRSMAFIGTECLAREVEADPTIELTEALKHLREHRWNGVQMNSQLYWMTLGSMYRLIKEYGFDMKIYDQQMAMFPDVVNRLVALDTISKYSDALGDEKKSDALAYFSFKMAGMGKKK